MIRTFEKWMMKDIPHYDYIVVGAGITGATFAQILSDRLYKNGAKKVLVLEERKHVGGNCYTENSNGIDVHMYGAHIFRTSKELIWNYVNKFITFISFNHKVVVDYEGKKYSFPINLMTLYQITNGKVCTPTQAEKYFKENGMPELIGSDDLESHCIGMIGKDLFDIFVRGYTEKQWGKKCSELPSSIIKRIPVRTTWNDNYFTDDKKFQGMPQKGGYTKMIENMLSNCDVIVGCNFLKDKEFWESHADKIIFTGAIDEFFEYKHGPLPWRSLKFNHSFIPNVNDYQGVPVMNYTSADVQHTRIIEHKHFCPWSKTQGTVITTEYPDKWELGKEKYYPMQDYDALQLYEKYERELIGNEKYIFAGRLGKYKYYDMDIAIENAMSVAFQLMKQESQAV